VIYSSKPSNCSSTRVGITPATRKQKALDKWWGVPSPSLPLSLRILTAITERVIHSEILIPHGSICQPLNPLCQLSGWEDIARSRTKNIHVKYGRTCLQGTSVMCVRFIVSAQNRGNDYAGWLQKYGRFYLDIIYIAKRRQANPMSFHWWMNYGRFCLTGHKIVWIRRVDWDVVQFDMFVRSRVGWAGHLVRMNVDML